MAIREGFKELELTASEKVRAMTFVFRSSVKFLNDGRTLSGINSPAGNAIVERIALFSMVAPKSTTKPLFNEINVVLSDTARFSSLFKVFRSSSVRTTSKMFISAVSAVKSPPLKVTFGSPTLPLACMVSCIKSIMSTDSSNVS